MSIEKLLSYSIAGLFALFCLCMVSTLLLLDKQKVKAQELEEQIAYLENRLDSETEELKSQNKALEGEVNFFLTGGWK